MFREAMTTSIRMPKDTVEWPSAYIISFLLFLAGWMCRCLNRFQVKNIGRFFIPKRCFIGNYVYLCAR